MSLFSNNNSNRRIKRSGPKRQQSLLEVSARPEKEPRRLAQRKVGGFFKGIILVAILCGGVFGGRILFKKLIWENPTYALDDIRVSTDGLLTRAQVLEIMEIQDGKNIFTVDLTKARKALDAMPQVERVDIRRVLPSRVDVRISERQPIAWVAPTADTELGMDGRAFLVDTRGYVMRTRKLLPEHLALPVITGVVMEDVAPGQKLPTAEAFSAIDLIKLSADDIRWQPRVVDISKGYCLLVTDHRKARVTFSFDNIEGQLARLRQIIDYVEPTQREFQSVNLMLERSVPIVFAPPPAPPTPVQESKGGKGKAAGKNGGVSGGVSSPALQSVPASAFVPPKVQAVTPLAQPAPGANAASQPQELPAPVAAPKTQQAKTSQPVAEKRAQPDPPSPFKLARLNPPSSATPPAEKPEPRVVEKLKTEMKAEPRAEKSKRRPQVSDADDEELVRPKKQAVPVSLASKMEKPVDKAKSALPAPAKTKPKNSYDSEPSSLPPDETLRKLFNPHG